MLHLISETELNPYADPRYANNGGGYHQPEFVFSGTIGRVPAKLVIRDTSCGEFGERWSVTLYILEWEFFYYRNTMEDEPKEENTIPKRLVQEIWPILQEYGYTF